METNIDSNSRAGVVAKQHTAYIGKVTNTGIVQGGKPILVKHINANA